MTFARFNGSKSIQEQKRALERLSGARFWNGRIESLTVPGRHYRRIRGKGHGTRAKPALCLTHRLTVRVDLCILEAPKRGCEKPQVAIDKPKAVGCGDGTWLCQTYRSTSSIIHELLRYGCQLTLENL